MVDPVNTGTALIETSSPIHYRLLDRVYTVYATPGNLMAFGILPGNTVNLPEFSWSSLFF